MTRSGVLAVLALACSPAPAPVAPTSSPPSTTSTTGETESTEREPQAPASEPEAKAITGVDACDRYLVAYQKCEAKLMPEIQSGNRRTYEAEKNWLVFMKDRPEKNELPASCAAMQTELDKSCP